MLRELDAMCRNLNFDRTYAENLIQRVDVNQKFTAYITLTGETTITLEVGETTLLIQAAEHSNLPMVELLLKHGADPNLIVDGNTVLWNLQYSDLDNPEMNPIRLDIVKLLLQNGADPFLEIDDDSVYSWAASDEYADEYKNDFLKIIENFWAKKDCDNQE